MRGFTILFTILLASSLPVAFPQHRRRTPPGFGSRKEPQQPQPQQQPQQPQQQQQEAAGTPQESGTQDSRRAPSFTGGVAEPFLRVVHPTPGIPIDCGDFFVEFTIAQGQTPPPAAAFALIVDDRYQVSGALGSRQNLTFSLKPLRPGKHMLRVHLKGGEQDFDISRADILFEFESEWRGSPPNYGPIAPAATFLRALNPAASWLRILHMDEVLALPRQQGQFEISSSMDWLGIRTRVDLDDCSVTGSYFAIQPSRHHQCIEHEKMAWFVEPGEEVMGILPAIDDEYRQLEAALASARLSPANSTSRKFVAVELGAWYGVWAMRAAAAFRLWHPEGAVRLVGVEPVASRVSEMETHWSMNGITDFAAMRGMVGGQSGTSPEGVPIFSLQDCLDFAGQRIVDYLDMDVQGAELPLLAEPGAADLIRSRVRCVIVVTHGADVHAGVKALLAEAGLVLEYEHEYNPLTFECDETARTGRQTDPKCLTWGYYGPIYRRDGLLHFSNPGLVS